LTGLELQSDLQRHGAPSMLRGVLVRVPELPRTDDRSDEAEGNRPEPGQRYSRVATEEGQAAKPEEHQRHGAGNDEGPLRARISNRREEGVDAQQDRHQERDEDDRLARRTVAVLPGAVASEAEELARGDGEDDGESEQGSATERLAQATACERGVVHADHQAGQGKRDEEPRERVDDPRHCLRSRPPRRHFSLALVVGR